MKLRALFLLISIFFIMNLSSLVDTKSKREAFILTNREENHFKAKQKFSRAGSQLEQAAHRRF